MIRVESRLTEILDACKLYRLVSRENELLLEFQKKECLPHCAMQAGRLDFSVPADAMALARQAGLLPFFVSRQKS